MGKKAPQVVGPLELCERNPDLAVASGFPYKRRKATKRIIFEACDDRYQGTGKKAVAMNTLVAHILMLQCRGRARQGIKSTR